MDRIFVSQCLKLPENTDGKTAVHEMLAELRSRDSGDLIVMIHRNLEIALTCLDKPRVIHLLRDPRDVAPSSVAMGWAGNVYYGSDHWISTEREWSHYASLIPSSRTKTLRFENLISDAEASLAEVCEFFDVLYDLQMLEYHQTSSYKPVDPALASQWKQKLSKADIALVETRVGGLLEERGFPPTDCMRADLSHMDKISLWLKNKISTLRFRVKRYGLRDVLLVAIARRLGVESLSAGAILRMNEISKFYLK
jgi:hypothetical protein